MLILNWSSPVRKSNRKTLSPIPNEIYHEIFAYIRPPPADDLNYYPLAKRDLCNLARVCRFFSATMLPWIFESICFDGISGGRSSLSSSENSFCRSILEGSGTARAMAQYVKKCEFMSWVLDENEWIHAGFLDLYVDALAYMPNIQELTLIQTTISKGLLKAIGGLRNLSTLSISSSTVVADVKRKHMKNLSLLKLKYCHFRSAPEELIPFINLDTILHLTVTQGRVPFLFSRDHGVIPLEKLDLFELGSASELEALLSRAPALKSLRIEQHEHANFDPLAVKQASGTLPLLSSMEGPLSLVKYFADNRPLSSIIISDVQDIASINSRDIETLLKSSRPISHLGISFDNHGDVPFWQHVPGLQSLEFDVIKDITNVWPRLPELRSLKFDIPWYGEPWSLSEQRQWILEILAPHFPAMRHCSFFGIVRWYYLESSASWIPEIAPRKYLDLCFPHMDVERLARWNHAGCFDRVISFTEVIDPTQFDRAFSRYFRRLVRK